PKAVGQVEDGRAGRQQRDEACGHVLEEAEAEAEGQASQLAIDRLAGRRQGPGLARLVQARPAAALIAQERLANEVDEGGEGEDVLKAASAMAVEDPVEEVGLQDVVVQGQDGVGQGQSGQHVQGERVRDRFLTGTQNHGRSSPKGDSSGCYRKTNLFTAVASSPPLAKRLQQPSACLRPEQTRPAATGIPSCS